MAAQKTASSAVTGKLAEQVGKFVEAKGTALAGRLGDRIESATSKLEDAAQNGGLLSGGLGKAAEKMADGASPASAALSAAGAGLKEKVKGLFGKGRKGGGKNKLTNIVEDIDIGVPVSVAYDQWTQFTEFASFAKGVEDVDQKDEVESTWRFKIAKAHRTVTTRVEEQIPDRRIVWTSEGPKGFTKGVVTFHPLADDLTRVLLVLEYYPHGFVEKTANLWRAAGRRARLDLKHFRRFVSMRGEATGSWRGEIADGEVIHGPDEDDEARDTHEDQEDTAEDREDAEGAAEDEEPDEAAAEEESDEAAAEEESDEEPEDEEPEEQPKRRRARARA